MLSPRLLTLLRDYWKVGRPDRLALPRATSPASPSPCKAVHEICVRARTRRGPGQARHCPHPAAQLRHPSARSRHRPPDDPGPARAPQPRDHRHLHPCLAGRPRRRPTARSTGSAPSRRRARSHDPTSARSGRGLPATTATPSSISTATRSRPSSAAPCTTSRACRTAALGGHVEECDQCGHQQIAYNSCRNRHCPKCQATAAARVDGGPGSRAAACRVLPRRLHAPGDARPDRACRTRGWSTASCSKPPPRPCSRSPPTPSTSGPRSASWPSSTPGARTCSITRTSIASCRAAGCRLTVRAGSPAGRASSCRCASSAASSGASSSPCSEAAFDRGRLSFHGKLAALADPVEFQRRLAASAQTEWVVYAKPPFGGPEQVLKYLARYTHRVAISNHRLVALEDGEVDFRWKDYAHGGAQKTMTLEGDRVHPPVPPARAAGGFVRIRHYGFLANRVCQEKLALCRALLGVEAPTPEDLPPRNAVTPDAGVAEPTRVVVCPVCGEGHMVIIETLARSRPPAGWRNDPQGVSCLIRHDRQHRESDDTNRGERDHPLWRPGESLSSWRRMTVETRDRASKPRRNTRGLP